MLRPDEIDKIALQISNRIPALLFSLERTERIIEAINLAGYKLVKSDDGN